MTDFGMTEKQVGFVNGVAGRVDALEEAMEALGEITEQVGHLTELTKSADTTTRVEELAKQVSLIVDALGIDLEKAAAEAAAMEEEEVVEGEAAGKKKKIKKWADRMTELEKSVEALKQVEGSRTSADVTGETVVEKSAPKAHGLFAGLAGNRFSA